MRVAAWVCLVLGFLCLWAAVSLGFHAIQHASEISAYHHARPCPPGATAKASCLRTVDGSVTAVTEFTGGGRISSDYELDVRTASTTLDLTFSSDSPMLGYAVDGDPAVVTMWRGLPVSVVTDGRSAVTTSIPQTAFTGDLRHGAESGGIGVFIVLIGLAIRITSRDTDGGAQSVPSPALTATPVVQASRKRPRRRRRHADWAHALGVGAAYLPILLTIAVLFGVLLSTHDGPAARAYRHAPGCIGESNLRTCVGDFTAVINGVRSPANGANGASVSYVTQDGSINTWAQFDGGATPIARLATADESARSLLRIRVWHRSIVGAELGGSWHWADGNPPSDTNPTVFLAVSFALLLFIARLRIHSQAGSSTDSQRLLGDDVGQVAAATGSILLLWYGFWLGAIPALATLLWLGLSARQSVRRMRMERAPLHVP